MLLCICVIVILNGVNSLLFFLRFQGQQKTVIVIIKVIMLYPRKDYFTSMKYIMELEYKYPTQYKPHYKLRLKL